MSTTPKRRVPPIHINFVQSTIDLGQDPARVLWYANAIAQKLENEKTFWVVMKNTLMMGIHLMEYQYKERTGVNIYKDIKAQDAQKAQQKTAAGAAENRPEQLTLSLT